MIAKFLEKLRNRENLSEEEISSAMKALMSGEVSAADTREFLLLMREKRATVEEITGAAKALRKFWVPVQTRHSVVLDTCGTGGDRSNTFNISTVVALIAAASGVAVAKHGNRSMSSRCGSADILEALGVRLLSDPQKLGACLDQVGIAFLFAQAMHPAMKNVASVRKELGVETVFNVLGPLINPARNTHQVMGIYAADMVEPIANVFKNLGLKRALVVHGSDGLDEITTTGKTFAAEWNGAEVKTYDIDPQAFGLPLAVIDDLRGGDIAINTAIVKDILDGGKGPKRDIVLLNAAYALYIAEKVKNPMDGLRLAEEIIDSGRARVKLQELVDFSNR